MNDEKMDQIENMLVSLCNECLDVRKLYEEELKSNYVHKKRIGELEGKIQSLEAQLASLEEQIKNAIEARHTPRQMEEERHRVEVEV